MSNAEVSMSKEDLESQLEKSKTAFENADKYHHLRPKYPVEYSEYLLKKIGVLSDDNEVILSDFNNPVTIVELGCGTGLLTQSMIAALEGKKNIRYFATDPTESMLQTFKKQLPEVEVRACTAEDLRTFEDNSVRAIVAAASYHWFANQKAYKEIYRVLEPHGMLGYISNLPSETDSDDWVKEMYKLIWDSYRRTGAPFQHDYKWRDALLASGLFTNYEEDFHLKYFQKVTIDECIQVFASFGGIASGGVENQRNFAKELAKILKKHFTDIGREFTGIEHTTEIQTSQSIKTKLSVKSSESCENGMK